MLVADFFEVGEQFEVGAVVEADDDCCFFLALEGGLEDAEVPLTNALFIVW